MTSVSREVICSNACRMAWFLLTSCNRVPDRSSLRDQRLWLSVSVSHRGDGMAEKPSRRQQEKVVKAVHITEDKETESMMGITDGMIFEGPPLENHSAREASLLKIP